MLPIYNYRTFATSAGGRFTVAAGGAVTSFPLPANTVTEIRIERYSSSAVKSSVLAYGWMPSDDAVRLVSVELPNDPEMDEVGLIAFRFDNPTGNAETVILSLDVTTGASRITV